MKKIKRIIAFMLFIVVLTGEYIPTEAEETQTIYTTDDGLSYTVDTNNEITIIGYSGKEKSVVIPREIESKLVTTIGMQAFWENKTIENISLPSSLERIERIAFTGCSLLTEIEFPKNLQFIGTGAFRSCYSLKKVVIYQNTVLEDGDENNKVFSGCASDFKIYCYQGSPAEAYAKQWSIPFVYNDRVPLTNITLPENITVNINERTEIAVTYGPENSYVGFHKIDSRSFTGPGVAQFETDENGKLYITGTQVGQNELSITKFPVADYMNDQIVSNVCKVNIVDPSIINATSLSITDKAGNALSNTEKVVDTYTENTSFELETVMTPASANETVTYESSNPYVATASQVDGIWKLQVFTCSTDKVATITATSNRTGQTSTFTVKTTYSGARDLSFNTENVNSSGDTVKIINQGTYNMPLVVTPSSLQNEIVAKVSDESVLKYDALTGIITPLKTGTTIINASVRGKSCSKTIVVSEYELNATSISFTTDDKLKSDGSDYTLAMNLDETYKVLTTVLPTDNTDIFRWKYDTNFLTITADGTIKALKAGTTTLYAITVSSLDASTTKAISGEVTITITDPIEVEEPTTPVEILATSIKINQSDCNMNLAETLQLSTNMLPINTTEKPVFDSSDKTIATVSDAGVVTIIGYGTVRIIANIRGMYDYITINVKAPITEPILTLNATSLNLKQGENYTLTETVTGNTNVSQILWDSENANVATIEQDGKIIARNIGSTTITGVLYCMDNSNPYRASCIVTVTGDSAVTTPITVESISLNTTSLSLEYGKSSTLSASLNPQGATGTIAWVSNNVSVATVNNAVVTAKGVGTCLITAFCNGISINCTVNVTPGLIKLNAKKFNLQKGKTIKALAISSSSYANDNIVSVTSSKPKVLKATFRGNQISLKGLKTSRKYVTVTVKTKSGATSKCHVKVVKNKVTTSKLKLNKKSVTLKKGTSNKLIVTKTPISSTDKLTWSSSNKKVVTVNKKGKIIAKKRGRATITLKSSNGKKVTCKVKVK